MPINITMPALSPTMEEGKLSKWLKKEGDTIKSGDVIAEIETDKATMEVEAVDEGTLAKILVPAGSEGVKVNTVIAVLAGEGEDVSSASSGAPAAPVPVATAPSAVTAAPAAVTAPAPAAAPVAAPAAAAPVAHGNRVFSSPLARRLAKEAGIDLSGVTGTGPHGRVVKSDIEKAVAGGGTKAPAAQAQTQTSASAAPAAAPMATGMSSDQVLKLFAEGSYELVPHDGMRKTLPSAFRNRNRPSRISTFPSIASSMPFWRCAPRSTTLRRCATASRPTSSRSMIWSSRRWHWRCVTFPMPTSPGPMVAWSRTSMPM